MKPRYRPGRPGTEGKSTRKAIAGAKPVSIKGKKAAKKANKKEGRGGKTKNIDFVESPKRKMKGAEYDAFSQDGIRRLPKTGRTIS